jgi:hypothetical protein
MTSQEQVIKTPIPGLRDIPVDRLAELDSAQAHAIARYRERPEAAFTALAEGTADPATTRLLRDAQPSKHRMLLDAGAQARSRIWCQVGRLPGFIRPRGMDPGCGSGGGDWLPSLLAWADERARAPST